MCNIAAAGASDSSQGLFFQKSLKPFQVYELDLCLDPSKWSRENPLTAKYIMTDLGFWDELSDAPLNQRGWMVQERLLARRVIHFGRDQLFWECGKTEACEKYPVKLPSTPISVMQTRWSRLTRDAFSPWEKTSSLPFLGLPRSCHRLLVTSM